jgi:hypothetical protein
MFSLGLLFIAGSYISLKIDRGLRRGKRRELNDLIIVNIEIRRLFFFASLNRF